MHKSNIVIVGSGAMIIVGLILVVVGNQLVLQDVVQNNGKVSITQPLVIQNTFDTEISQTGIFGINIIDFEGDTFHARVIDPHGTTIVSEEINSDTFETKFEINDNGEYELIVEGTNSVEKHVFGAIGPLPDAGKKAFENISVYVLAAGMAGIIIGAIYMFSTKRRHNTT